MTGVTFSDASNGISFFSQLTDLKFLPEVLIMFEQYCKICFLFKRHDYCPELQAHVMFLVKLICNPELFCIRRLFDSAM